MSKFERTTYTYPLITNEDVLTLKCIIYTIPIHKLRPTKGSYLDLGYTTLNFKLDFLETRFIFNSNQKALKSIEHRNMF